MLSRSRCSEVNLSGRIDKWRQPINRKCDLSKCIKIILVILEWVYQQKFMITNSTWKVVTVRLSCVNAGLLEHETKEVSRWIPVTLNSTLNECQHMMSSCHKDQCMINHRVDSQHHISVRTTIINKSCSMYGVLGFWQG